MTAHLRPLRPVPMLLACLVMLAALLSLAAASPSQTRGGAPLSFSLVVGTSFCPSEIQSEADLLAAGIDECPGGVLPADYPTLPSGYTTDLVSADFAYRVETADATNYPWSDFFLNGGGSCDPGTHTCSFGYGYRVDFLTSGVATLKMTTLPDGYRLGTAFVTPGTDPLTLHAPLTLDTMKRVLTFDIGATECPNNFCNVWVFLFAGAAPASPTPAASVPDTRAASGGDGINGIGWLLQVLVVALVLSALALAGRVGGPKRLH